MRDSHWHKPELVNTFYAHLHITNFTIYVCLQGCTECCSVYGSYLWMWRRECCGIFGFGVRNAFYESFMAFNVETPADTHTHTYRESEIGATWRWLYAALASHNQRQAASGLAKTAKWSSAAWWVLSYKKARSGGGGGHLYLYGIYIYVGGCAICSRARSVYHPGLILVGHGFH